MTNKHARCNRTGKVKFDEIGAKLALARRVWGDKGEIRYYKCGRHYHLTSQESKHAHQR